MDAKNTLKNSLGPAGAAVSSLPPAHALQGALKFKAALVFFCGLLLGGAGIFWIDHSEVEQHKLEAMAAASVHGHLLEQQLTRSMSATYALAAVLRQGNGRIEDFDALATQMLPMYGGLSALQLAPNGVIRQIVPLTSHQAAVGHNLLDDPERNREAFLALSSRALTLAGPFELRQGGQAVVGRLPVFLEVGKKDEHFWGFVTALVRIPDLLHASALSGEGVRGHEFELSRVSRDGGTVQSIWRSTERQLLDPLSIPVAVPNGEWTLSVVPAGGWHMPMTTLFWLIVTVVAVSGLSAIQAYHLLRQPLLLSQEVAVRTAELNDANQSLQTEIFQHWQTELALRESERQLEQRVQERTRELAQANGALLDERAEQKALIARLADTQSQLLQSRMMAAVGQLAAGVAHEINNPLAFIISNVAAARQEVEALLGAFVQLTDSLVSDEPDDKALVAEMLRIKTGLDLEALREDLVPMIQDSLCGLYRVRDIVRDLRELSSSAQESMQVIDVNRCVENVLAELSGQWGGGVSVSTTLEELPAVMGNAAQLGQAFRNILNNAVQAIDGNGQIHLATRQVADTVEVEFSDTGCGIESDQLAHVFEPFFSTRDVGQGKGLGLAVAYHVVQSHGGDIAVTSEPGKGARFTVSLPVRPPT